MRFLCSFCESVLERQACGFKEITLCHNCGKETLTPASRIALGVVIDDFVLMEALGEGRICTLHLAYQLSLHRQVLLQILKRELVSNARYVDEFVMDARCMARLLHPHIVHAYALGEVDGTRFAALEYLEGYDLGMVLQEQGPLPLVCAMMLLRQMAEALHYIWQEHQLLHRDIKPANIFLSGANFAKLTGFRLACRAEDLERMQDSDAIVGTAPYMSPEHILGTHMDVRSDLYSLGATFYHLMTGQLPFVGSSAQEIARGHLEEELLPAHQLRPEMPEGFSHILQRLMAKELDARYENAQELIDAIDDVLIEVVDTLCEEGIAPRSPGLPGLTAWRNPATILE